MSDFVLLPYLKDISVFNANSVDSDQTPRPAASDLDLYCLPMSLLWDSRYKLLRELIHVSGEVTLTLFCVPSEPGSAL